MRFFISYSVLEITHYERKGEVKILEGRMLQEGTLQENFIQLP